MLLSVVSVGVKVTLSEGVPAPGAMLGVVQAKVPPTEAVPPDKVEEARVCPYVIDEAVDQAETVGVALYTGIGTVAVEML
jgi:hypothetical protein